MIIHIIMKISRTNLRPSKLELLYSKYTLTQYNGNLLSG